MARRKKKAKKTGARVRPAKVAEFKVADWLESSTGKTTEWWVWRVQELIKKHSRPSKDPKHDQTNVTGWLIDLMGDVRKVMPNRKDYDGNMRAAQIFSMVLSMWVLRLTRAKAYDPRRPVKLRRDAYYWRLIYQHALFAAMVDESKDQKHFPGQRWETPFDPYPTDGVFI